MNHRRLLKNLSLFIAAWFFTMSNLALAEDKELIESITDNVKKVCSAPEQKEKYWDVHIDGNLDAGGLVRLKALGVNGEASFNKGEWEGVQKVLKEQQIDENKNYRECVKDLTKLFLEKFNASSSTNSKNSNKSKSSTKSEPVKSTTIHQESQGRKNANVNKTGDGDVNINIQ